MADQLLRISVTMQLQTTIHQLPGHIAEKRAVRIWPNIGLECCSERGNGVPREEHVLELRKENIVGRTESNLARWQR